MMKVFENKAMAVAPEHTEARARDILHDGHAVETGLVEFWL